MITFHPHYIPETLVSNSVEKMLKQLRTVLQVVACSIFLYQVEQSMEKFLKHPIVEQLSQTTIDKIKLPVVYLCQNGQYNISMAKSLGYDWNTYFLAGRVTNSTFPSWRGIHQNMSFKEVQTSWNI